MAIIILTLCLEFRYVRDGSFLASLCLCLSRIISTIVSCLLLFTGVLAGKEPPKALCIAQSALERAQEPLLTSSILSYAGNLLIALSTVNSPNGLLVQFAKGLIFVFPFLLFAMLSIISLLASPSFQNRINDPIPSCSVKVDRFQQVSTLISVATLVVALVIILQMSFLVQRLEPRSHASQSSQDLRWRSMIGFHLIALGIYCGAQIGVLIAFYLKPTVSLYMVQACDGIVTFIILVTQGWMIQRWRQWTCGMASPRAPERPISQVTAPRASRRLQKAPSSRKTRSQFNVESIHDERGQEMKITALAAALGLHEEMVRSRAARENQGETKASTPSFGLQIQEVPLDPSTSNRPGSVRSWHYGIALGYPSRDRFQESSIRLERASEGERSRSMIILTTPPLLSGQPFASNSESQNSDPLEYGFGRNILNGRRTASSAGSGEAKSPSPPVVESNTSHEDFAMQSLPRNQQDSRPTSFIPVSMNSGSHSSHGKLPSDTAPYRSSPLRHSSTFTRDEQAYERSSITAPSTPLLVDNIVSSVISFPNISVSTFKSAHRHEIQASQSIKSRSLTDLAAQVSPSAVQSSSYATPRTTPPHSPASRDQSPSPLSLDIGRVLASPGPSQAVYSTSDSNNLHPYAQGNGSLPPPGLHPFAM